MSEVRAYDAEGKLVAARETDPGYLSKDGASPCLAGHIEVVHRRGKFSLKVDGVDFPWYISEEGIATLIGSGNLGAVTVTILADRVTVDNDWR